MAKKGLKKRAAEEQEVKADVPVVTAKATDDAPPKKKAKKAAKKAAEAPTPAPAAAPEAVPPPQKAAKKGKGKEAKENKAENKDEKKVEKKEEKPKVDYEDKEMDCQDCNQKFTWTAGQQEFFASRSFGEPKRCKECTLAKKGKGGKGKGKGKGGKGDAKSCRRQCSLKENLLEFHSQNQSLHPEHSQILKCCNVT